jgi:hypothetical protein
MKRTSWWLPVGLLATLGILIGLLGFSIWEKLPVPVQPVAWSSDAQWAAPQTPNYRFYARHTFTLSDNVESSWLRLSADNDFTLYVNGRRIARENSVLNNALGLGAGLRIPFQDVNDSNSYRSKPSVNYLIASSKDWKLTAYVDLAPHLKPGKNVIALEVQKGQENPRFVLEGSVKSGSGNRSLNLTTGMASWRVSNLSETKQSLQWYDSDFSDVNWSEARLLGPVKATTYSRLSKNLFDRSLQGSWISGEPNPQGDVYLRGNWQVSKAIPHAYIRFSGKGSYSVLLNGTFIKYSDIENSNHLYLLDIAKILHPGKNTLAVHLEQPLDTGLISSNSNNLDGALKFFLDGWTESEKSEVSETIATDLAWISLPGSITAWEQGAGDGKPINLIGPPEPQQFQKRSFEGNAYLLNYPSYLWHQSLWQISGIIFVFIYALALGWKLSGEQGWWNRLNAGTAILVPGTLFLVGIGLLKHRYAEAEAGLLFAQPQSNPLILVGFVGVVLLTLILTKLSSYFTKWPRWILWLFCGMMAVTVLSLGAGSKPIWIFLVIFGVTSLIMLWKYLRQTRQLIDMASVRYWQTWGAWIPLLAIVGIGFILRVYQLDFIDLDADENTSLDAVRGILRTGSPISTSGIWYSRGPFYHYLLTMWLGIIGDSVANARFFSVIAGVATLPLTYILSQKVTKTAWISLSVTAILAVSSWEIWYSRNIRFYQVLQLLTVSCFWLFIRGFIEKSGRRYQVLFFINLTLMLLTQEVSLTILPAFFIGFLFFYRPLKISRDWIIALGFFLTSSIFAYCLYFSSIRLLTPLAALSESTGSYLKLHFSNVSDLMSNFLLGPDRMQMGYSLSFFLGFFYFLRRRWSIELFLWGCIVSQLLLTTIISYQSDERYVYAAYPVFVLLSVYSAVCILDRLCRILELVIKGLVPLRAIGLSFVILLLIGNLEPARALGGFQEAINRRNTQVFEYVKEHKLPNDVVVSPLPSLAVTSLGKLDYFLMGKGYFDATYWREGRLIDRWAGGQVISNLDQLNHVLENSKRVWLHLEDSREGRFSPEVWEYVETLGRPVIDSFGTRLRLWQPEDGLPRRVPNTGKDLGAY